MRLVRVLLTKGQRKERNINLLMFLPNISFCPVCSYVPRQRLVDVSLRSGRTNSVVSPSDNMESLLSNL